MTEEEIDNLLAIYILKHQVVKVQKYELAAMLRDMEKTAISKIDSTLDTSLKFAGNYLPDKYFDIDPIEGRHVRGLKENIIDILTTSQFNAIHNILNRLKGQYYNIDEVEKIMSAEFLAKMRERKIEDILN